MPFLDPVVAQNVSRVKRSDVPGESPGIGALRPGELAANVADGVIYVGTNDGMSATLPKAVGFSQIVVIEQAAYEDAGFTPDPTVLYIVIDPD